MAQRIEDRNTGERNSLALVFLVTFGILTLLSVWFVYQEFAQVFTRTGQCTVLSFSTRQDIVNTDDPTEGAQYSITFKVLLLTPDGQRLQVPGYYTSANYDASDQNTIKSIEKSYPVGSTVACGYTYLDPSGIKALFQPAIPLEGFFFPGFFLLLSLTISVICIVNLRKKPAPEIPLPDEAVEAESADPQQV